VLLSDTEHARLHALIYAPGSGSFGTMANGRLMKSLRLFAAEQIGAAVALYFRQ